MYLIENGLIEPGCYGGNPQTSRRLGGQRSWRGFFFFCMELGPEGEEEEKWHLNYRSEGRREGGREVGRLRGGERGEREGGKEFNMEDA